MTPYGIVYRDNPYALQKSVEIWQKKFGVFNAPTFLKFGGISVILLFAVSIIMGIFDKENFISYASTFLLIAVLTFVLIYSVINNTYIKQMALTNTQKEEKQIVLYDDRLEFGTPYSKAVYYYSDIAYCCEQSETITLIIDTAAMPFSIHKSSILKGSYDEFSFRLRSFIGSKYEYMGGKRR